MKFNIKRRIFFMGLKKYYLKPIKKIAHNSTEDQKGSQISKPQLSPESKMKGVYEQTHLPSTIIN